MSAGSRARVLARVRAALVDRQPVAHPGAAPLVVGGPGSESAIDRFASRFQAAGGEVVRVTDEVEGRARLTDMLSAFERVSTSPRVPDALRFDRPESDPEVAELGVSLAVAACADSGSLLLSGREGRRLQLLPRVHLVWVHASSVHEHLEAALAEASDADTSSLALHSGPSKSADIGQILVTGVHGPARVIAAIFGGAPGPGRDGPGDGPSPPAPPSPGSG